MDDELGPLIRVLRAAATAHHEAFAHVDGHDPDWPAWYASWLQPRLLTDLGRDALAAMLDEAAAAHGSTASEEPWAAFYARFLHHHGIKKLRPTTDTSDQ